VAAAVTAAGVVVTEAVVETAIEPSRFESGAR
jgi:hypothetical protein